ncbi:MAG: C-GCAxxG-C-C family (seleno)protein [Phascolarctobacterium faecium]
MPEFCGALVGCTMVISTLIGRNTPEEKPLKEIYPVTKEFHDRFEKNLDQQCVKI